MGPGRGQLSHSSPTPFAPVVSLKNHRGAHAALQAGGLRITRVGTLDTRSYLQTPECAAKIQNCSLSCSTSFPAPESTDTVITPAPHPSSPHSSGDPCPCLDGDTSTHLHSDQASVCETWSEESTSWVNQVWQPNVTPEGGGQRLCSGSRGWTRSPHLSQVWGARSGVL